MADACRTLLLQLVCLSALLNTCFGSYAITTPRKWAPGKTTQVCVVLYNATSDSPNEITVELTSKDESEVVLPGNVIRVPEGEKTWCASIFLPEVIHRSLVMKVTGTLTDKKVDHTKKIIVAQGVTKTFIQTDKPVYKPGQEVQFRILTAAGPFLRILKKNYNVWIETPSGSRVAQWTNVDNSAGLIHLAFTLADEPEEGQYAIKVRLSEGGSTTSQVFKVEEYVLPRFEVSVIPPKYAMIDDAEFTFFVCAKNTLVRPVRGDVTLEIKRCSRTECRDRHVVRDKISGCKKFKVMPDDIQLNGRGFFAIKLAANATVVEEGTDQEAKAEVSVTLFRSAVDFTDVGNQQFLKPNLPYTKRIKATRRDGSSLADEVVRVCVHGMCKGVMTGPDGILEIVVPFFPINFIDVGDTIIYYSTRYFSPSQSSLVIQVPEDRLPCSSDGHNLTLPVLFAAVNQTKALVSVQVVSRGQIQFSSAEEYEFTPNTLPIKKERLFLPFLGTPEHAITGVLNIPVYLPRSASPSAKVLVWYARPDGEVVSDAKVIDIEKCFGNEVNLGWSSDRVLPGAQATLRLSASPNSLCSLGVVDKRGESLSPQTDEITLEKVFDILESAMAEEGENHQYNDDEYCHAWHERNQPVSSTPPAPEVRLPSLDDLLLNFVESERPQSPYNSSSYVDALKMFDKSGLFILTDLTTETRPCDTYSAGYYDDYTVPDSDADQQRTPLPETWLWKIDVTDASGVLSEEYTLPDTITEWVGKAVCVSPETGLGISQRASITTFTPFFVDLTLPPSVKRGEILPLKISVFNYFHHALPVKLILEESSQYEVLQEPDNQLPLTNILKYIPARGEVVHTVKIRSLVLGNVNITIDASVDDLYQKPSDKEHVLNKRDVLIKPIKVEAEGFPREQTWTTYVCSKHINERASYLANLWIELPPVIVEDSARGWVTAVGDLLGPTLENLGSLVRMPHGCGEQNMLNFASNIFILQYLEASNRTTPDITRKAIHYMEQGYQNELRYRHSDGSFSAFGSSDASGSTWLTAFVLKSFAQARQFIQVDGKVLKKTQDWLEMKQQENGCFQSGGSDGSSSLVPLTSYVLIALLESGGLTTSKAVMGAANCLHADTSRDPYTLALKAYALALSEAPEANQALQNLLSVATESSNSLYWELPGGSGNSEAVAVETAGYAVLAMMTLDAKLHENQARKIVKWISSQRNGQGGFISTQDTVVALQALASFEAHRHREPVNLTISVQAEGVEHAFSIDESNKLLQQQVNLPSIPTNVILDMEGQGCSLVQAVLRYNVPESSASDAFALSVTTETVPDKNCITKKIKACASYLLPDQKSNMAVVEFNLVSGYIPLKDDLKEIVGNGRGLLKRYEVDGSKVDFYFDEFSSEDTCVQFRIIREVDVEDAKRGTVRVYDYYQPEFSVSKTYTLPPPDDCQTERRQQWEELMKIIDKMQLTLKGVKQQIKYMVI